MRFMIVDDDQQIREGIHFGIDWGQEGFAEIRDYENGLDALQDFKAFRPDVILADIRMPEMDGIEFLQEIRRRDSDVRFIFLSAYSDFEYCKKAITLGANDYELKPIRMAKLLDVIRENVAQSKRIKAQRIEQQKMYQKSLIEDALQSGEMKQENQALFREHFQWFHATHLLVALIEPETADEFDQSSCLTLIENRLSKTCPESPFVLQQIWDSQIIAICPDNSVSTLMVLERQFQLKQWLLDISRQLQFSRKGLFLSGGISQLHPLEELPNAYLEAQRALQDRFYHGVGTITVFHHDIAPKAELPFEKDEISKQIIGCVRNGDEDTLFRLIDEAAAAIRANRVSPQTIHWFLISICSNMDDLTGQSIFGSIMHEKSLTSKTLEALLQTFRHCAKEALNIYSKNSERNGLSPYIHQALQFIDSHYYEPLTVEQIANRLNKSPNHFSSVFKKEMACSFSEYLTNLRMKTAKHMIDTTAEPIHTIAASVGYYDYAYFSRRFRKLYGLSPSEMRNTSHAQSPKES